MYDEIDRAMRIMESVWKNHANLATLFWKFDNRIGRRRTKYAY